MNVPPRGFRRISAVWTLFVLVIAAGLPVVAAPPVLREDPQYPLEGVFRTGKRYTVRVQYLDRDGDRPRTALFIDQSQGGGKVNYEKAQIIGTDYKEGVTLAWDVPGFAQGGHQAEFVVTSTDGSSARLPYNFAVEDLLTKWVIMGAGMLVGLLFLPFLVYVLARSMNRRGDLSRAARVGLLLGILACCALFIYLFASTYGPLTYVIGGIAALALLIVVLTRR